jgi:hypothetical protein
MNDTDRIPPDDAGTLSDALRWQLRAQRRDIEPTSDLWPGIATKLETPPRRATRTAPWFAVAASVLVMVGVALLMRPRAVDVDAIARVEGQKLSQDFNAAINDMPAAGRSDEIQPALSELDRTARDIRKALNRDPDSRLLLDQLRRTYTLRLALSQRAALS